MYCPEQQIALDRMRPGRAAGPSGRSAPPGIPDPPRGPPNTGQGQPRKNNYVVSLRNSFQTALHGCMAVWLRMGNDPCSELALIPVQPPIDTVSIGGLPMSWHFPIYGLMV